MPVTEPHLAAPVAASSTSSGQPERREGECSLYIGTYTDGSSKGILHARFDSNSGRLTQPELAIETPSPTFLAIHPHGPVIYAVNEIDKWNGQPVGSVGAYSITAPGKLTRLNEVSSKGAGPCHITLDSLGRTAIVANYGSGSLASYSIEPDGRLSEAVSFFQYEGSGPNKDRQEAPHAHSSTVSSDDRFVVACDLGTDLLHLYTLSPNNSKLTQHAPPTVHAVPGGGPRHFAFDPLGEFAFVVNEMGNSVTSFAWDASGGRLQEIETVSTLPSGFQGESITAEIRVHPANRHLYVSNRGHDSIAVFGIERDGRLSLVGITPSEGKAPRNFNFDPSGRWLLAANQDSDNIMVFEIAKDGTLQATGTVATCGAPVCLRFAC